MLRVERSDEREDSPLADNWQNQMLTNFTENFYVHNQKRKLLHLSSFIVLRIQTKQDMHTQKAMAAPINH